MRHQWRPQQQDGFFSAARRQPAQQQRMADDPPSDPQADPPADPPADPKAGDSPPKEKSLLEMGDEGGEGAGGGGGAAAAAPYHPEGIREDLKGKTDQETIDKAVAMVNGLREQLSRKGGGAPEKPEDYDFAGIAKEFGAPADEANPVNAPVFKLLRAVFHKRGLSQDAAAGIAGDVLKGMKEGGLLDAVNPMAQIQVSAEKELGEMASQFGGRDKALKIVKDERTYLQNLQNMKIIGPDDHAELLIAMGTAKGLRAFQKLRAHFTGHELPKLDDSSQTVETVASIKRRWADPRFNTDPAFRAESERMLAEAQKGAKTA